MRKKMTAAMIFLFCSLVVFAMLPQMKIESAGQTIYVEPGIDVLQVAINRAQPGDTLILREGLYYSAHISYDNPQKFKYEYQYAEKVAVDKPLTIRGQGQVYIRDNPFWITADNVIIDNISFIDTFTRLGAGIGIDGTSSITVRNCAFLGNKALHGAGIYIRDSSDITVQDCLFRVNEANFITSYRQHFGDIGLRYIRWGSGAGAYVINSSRVTFKKCDFLDNSTEFVGGALTFHKSGLNNRVENCTFSDNRADRRGGALYLNESTSLFHFKLSVIDNTFTGNEAAYGHGGAISSEKGILYLSGCDLSENKARSGGAISALYGELKIEASSFIENESFLRRTKDLEDKPHYGTGGAVDVFDTKLRIGGSRFIGNFASDEGGALSLFRSAGSAAYQSKIITSEFIGNSSQKGGAVINYAFGTEIEDCLFQENSAEAMGGALYSLDSVFVKRTEFNSNSAASGGAVAVVGLRSLVHHYEDCVFDNNRALDKNLKGEGGAIYADGSKVRQSMFVNGCEFIKNTSYNGGAITLNSRVKGEVEDSEFFQNFALNWGGALYHSNQADMVVRKSIFMENRAEKSGGACYNHRSDLNISRSKFIDNQGDIQGGAIYGYGGRIWAVNSLFSGNQALAATVLLLDGTNKSYLTNCTITENYGGQPAIFARASAHLNMCNNIVVSNMVIESVSEMDVLWTDNSSVEATYNLCALEGEGNIEGSIGVFRSIADRDYRLRYDFMWGHMGAMDKGNNAAISQNRDLAGNRRFVDNDGDGRATVDLGAYEVEYVKVTFESKHPLDGVEYGEVSGDTEQWILQGDSPDMANVVVTAVDGWEFDYWKTLDHTMAEVTDPFHSSVKLYAAYKQKEVKVTFKYDPEKLRIATAGRLNIDRSDPEMNALITYVKQYHTPPRPEMRGVNGWVFGTWNPWPGVVSEDSVFVAEARAAATYRFGTGGYYEDNGNNKEMWKTDLINPLKSPEEDKIVTYPGYEFSGWSDSPGGEVITLPNSITEPKTYYAQYQTKQFTLTVDLDGQGALDIDPSGSYDYGTTLDLTDETVLKFSPNSDLYCIGFVDGEGKRVNLTALNMIKDTTIKAQYIDVPDDSLIVSTPPPPLLAGTIDLLLAEAMGFVVPHPYVSFVYKDNPDGSENLLALIVPHNTGFTGFQAAVSNSDLTLTAEYTVLYFRFTPKFFR